MSNGNEPVAWAMFKGNTFMDAIHPDEHTRFEGGYTIPLYTHQYERPHNTVLVPCDKLAQMQAELALLKAHLAKTLTDEEIIEVHVNTPFIDGYLNKNLIAFARAILKKAQDK